ncbi:MAG: hypothetical protein IT440_16310, partial [Phycisphaeraceae bacterium]|nr:hypothetical protein [Phycisphaeraceae bacterium]
ALVFLSGDTLHGELVSVDPRQGVTWKHPDAAVPIVFGLPNLREIKLAPGPVESAMRDATAVIYLTNDDQVLGTLVGITDAAVLVDTAYAGRLTLVRSMVRSILPGTKAAGFTYEGPTGMDGWTAQRGGGGTWTFKNGALVSTGRNGFIGRDVGIPDVASISLDLAWRGQPQFTLSFCGERVDNPNQGAYVLNISGDYFNLYRFSPQSGSNELGSFNQAGFALKGSARLSVYVDRTKKSVALMLNGVLVRQFTDSASKAPAGKCLSLGCNQGLLRVSNITVGKWDGKADAGTTTAGGEEAGSDDCLHFANGDKVRGKLKTVTNGKITFVTAYATMDVPLERVATMEFGKAGLERARRNANDVQLVFASGARITVGLEQLAAGRVTGASENFGNMAAKLGAFAKVYFNIYDDRREADVGAGEW